MLRFLRLGIISSCRQLSLAPLVGCLLKPGRHHLCRAWRQQHLKVLAGQRLQLLWLPQIRIAAQHGRLPRCPKLRPPLSASLAAPTLT